jgi:hypothetical protein
MSFARTLYALFIAVILALATSSTALADATTDGDFTLSLGYANVSIGNSSSELNSMNAFKWEASFTLAPIREVPQLRLGAALGVPLVLDDTKRTFISHNGTVIITGSSDIPLFVIEPEVRISWRQSFGQFFIEPGVGFGGAFAYLSIDTDGDDGDETFDKWQSTWASRAFLYAGFEVTGGLAGLEASYMRGGSMDFGDNAHGDISEFYIGIFGTLQF